MKIELPTSEQIQFYSQFKSFKLVNKGKYNEYLEVKTSDVQSIMSLTELQRKYIEVAERALSKGCSIGFTFKEYIEMLGKPCVYCGNPSESIDRINSKGCYTLNNVQQTCKMCNFMKYTYSDKDFKDQVRRIYTHLIKKE